MALLKEESYTIEDIYALPDGERAELIDGHIYYIIVDLHKIFNTDHLAATLFYICNLLLSQVIVHQNLFLNVLVINVNRQKFRLKVYMLFAGL